MPSRRKAPIRACALAYRLERIVREQRGSGRSAVFAAHQCAAVLGQRMRRENSDGAISLRAADPEQQIPHRRRRAIERVHRRDRKGVGVLLGLTGMETSNKLRVTNVTALDPVTSPNKSPIRNDTLPR